MPRRREVPKRKITPDPKYGDKMVAKFVNVLMSHGEKSTAWQILYRAFDLLAERTGDDPIKTFKKALDNVKPLMEVSSRRVGGATFQVPREVRTSRGIALSMRWIHDCSRKRSERTMHERLAAEAMDASQNRGNAVKKREDTHRMAEANKAFAHYKWT